MTHCPECGAQLAGDEVVCPHCLARLTTKAGAAESGARARRSDSRFRPIQIQEIQPPAGEAALSPLPAGANTDAVATQTGAVAAPKGAGKRRKGSMVEGLREARAPGIVRLPAWLYRARWLALLALVVGCLALGALIGRLQSAATQPAGPSLFEQGMQLYQAGRYDAANFVFGQALQAELDKPEPKPAETITMMGWSAYRMGRYREAYTRFRASAAMEPERAATHVGLSLVLLELGELDAAQTAAERGALLDPTAPAAHLALGDIYLARGQPAEALKAFQRAAALDPDDAQAGRRVGLALFALKDYPGAIAPLQLAAEAGGDRAVWRALIESHLAVGAYDAAAEAAAKAGAAYPEDAEWPYLAGMGLLRAGRAAEAEAAFRDAADRGVADTTPAALRAWGLALSNQEKYAEALEPLGRAVALAPDDVEALELQGWALARIGRCADALPIFERALTLKPDSTPALEGDRACRQWLGMQ